MSQREEVTEITVEDPAPGFSKLRDITDLKKCIEASIFDLQPNGPSFYDKLDDATISNAQKVLKITKQQIVLCYEVLKLKQTNMENEECAKKFRLMVCILQGRNIWV
eukprot:CAMPEP_0117744058 /NCGR_PEP_ID=MMETSP0947-20121206/6521_1 /TAXON_ID=44440 /ORGANISM="Chattonella subsalsa, Strain CCMP2191" /LENGTH=106 /DNA_ID=CAMNT_0005560911 /DNA_START=281 /DNA_END=601 /DNA_ORIENTATION=-